MIASVPYLLERIEVSRLTESYGTSPEGQSNRIIREQYEYTGRTRICPNHGLVHIFRLMEIRLDEFKHADDGYGGGADENEEWDECFEDEDHDQ